MIGQVVTLVSRHRRLIFAGLLTVVLLGVLVGVERWQPGATPPQILTVISDQCRLDPAHVAPPPKQTNYLHTCSSRIYDSQGKLVQITGISWFGFETSNMVVDGLYARNWQTILDQLAALGYNTIRLPFSDDVLKPGSKPSGINYLLNPDLTGLTSLQIMDRVVDGARQRGLRILLDRHRPNSAGQTDLWYTPTESEATWIANWVTLAKRYQGNDTVIGADLNNEPRGPATWGTNDPKTDWRLAAQKAGNAILAVDPYWLIFVQGIEHIGNDWYWWGGNLEGVAHAPVVLTVPNRVVYSPHDYGPEVYPQGWFKVPSFPNNLPSVWDQHWGFIAEQGIAPVVLGEFGGRSVGVDAEGQWQRALIGYMSEHNFGYISWALNPDSGDTGGILEDDWVTVQSSKVSLYDPGRAAPIPSSNSAAPGSLPTIRVTYHNAGGTAGSPNVAFEVSIFNDGATAIPLDQLDLRYWIAQDPSLVSAVVDWANLGNSHVGVKVVPAACGTQTGYLDVTFDIGSGDLAGYGTTGPILIRYHLATWATIDPSRDYSYGASTTDQTWPRIQLARGSGFLFGSALSC
jgi:endoglucanase